MKGLLIVVSGPSGAGKGTVLKKALAENKNFKLSISATTRQPRQGEVNGVNYYFKTMDEFMEMLHNGDFLEYQEVYGNLYGTPKTAVEKELATGNDVILEIDVKGALNVKKMMPESVMIFLVPKNNEILCKRLIERNTESKDDLEKRISEAKNEIKNADKYDYIIINDDADTCSNDFCNIINAEKSRAFRNIKFIKSLL